VLAVKSFLACVVGLGFKEELCSILFGEGFRRNQDSGEGKQRRYFRLFIDLVQFFIFLNLKILTRLPMLKPRATLI
jgi:hypothetical protein